MPELVYFDSCVFIELLQQGDKDRFDACESLRERAQKAELLIVTSSWTIVEVNKLPDTAGLPEEQSKKILEFFENPYISIRLPDRRTVELAHNLTRTNGLKPADALHVATAVVNRVPVMYTYDASQGRRRGLLSHNLKIGTPPLRIEKPPDPSKGTLFGKEVIEAVQADNADPPILKIVTPTEAEPQQKEPPSQTG